MKRESIIHRLTMPLPELETYYRERRKERYESGAPFTGVKLRRALHPVLLFGLKVMHLFTGQRVTTIGDKRTPTTRPKIFAATHIGWDDPAVAWHAIRDHAYVFWGDPGYSYRTSDGFFMDVNGAICCDTGDKTDRFIGKETCIKWLSQGGNLLIFPEGAWNATAALPVMPLYNGTAEMAIRTGAEIIPFAFERYGKHHVVNIGKNLSPDGFDLSGKQALTDLLRDELAALRWEIWSGRPQEKRSDIPANYMEQYLKEIESLILDESYSMEAIERTRFHTKAETAQRDAFAHLSQIEPTPRNAFLFRKDA